MSRLYSQNPYKSFISGDSLYRLNKASSKLEKFNFITQEWSENDFSSIKHNGDEYVYLHHEELNLPCRVNVNTDEVEFYIEESKEWSLNVLRTPEDLSEFSPETNSNVIHNINTQRYISQIYENSIYGTSQKYSYATSATVENITQLSDTIFVYSALDKVSATFPNGTTDSNYIQKHVYGSMGYMFVFATYDLDLNLCMNTSFSSLEIDDNVPLYENLSEKTYTNYVTSFKHAVNKNTNQIVGAFPSSTSEGDYAHRLCVNKINDDLLSITPPWKYHIINRSGLPADFICTQVEITHLRDDIFCLVAINYYDNTQDNEDKHAFFRYIKIDENGDVLYTFGNWRSSTALSNIALSVQYLNKELIASSTINDTSTLHIIHTKNNPIICISSINETETGFNISNITSLKDIFKAITNNNTTSSSFFSLRSMITFKKLSNNRIMLFASMGKNTFFDPGNGDNYPEEYLAAVIIKLTDQNTELEIGTPQRICPFINSQRVDGDPNKSGSYNIYGPDSNNKLKTIAFGGTKTSTPSTSVTRGNCSNFEIDDDSVNITVTSESVYDSEYESFPFNNTSYSFDNTYPAGESKNFYVGNNVYVQFSRYGALTSIKVK